MDQKEKLSLHSVQVPGRHGPIVVLGEVLWDLLPTSACLGGAPLNFASHARKLGYEPILISAVGMDDLGAEATRRIIALGLEVSLLGHSRVSKTGTATVCIDPAGQPSFTIERPAAYDDVDLTPAEIEWIVERKPSWLYYGTLYASAARSKTTLDNLMGALPDVPRFYDVNLRPGFENPPLVEQLLARADVVKLNESEAQTVARVLSLPPSPEAFCRCGAQRFGWRAVCVTLGERGCAMFDGLEFIRAEGQRIQVVDSVGAGDAFAAAFLHGLVQNWPVTQIAVFANRVGALVASRAGAIPDWSLAEAAVL